MNQDRTKKAQHYHATRDVEASKEHHQQISVEEGHGSSGDIIKSLVFGGLDGIITTFAIVCAVQGSENLGSKVVIMMGIANLVADAISMGLGDYLSEKAENEKKPPPPPPKRVEKSSSSEEKISSKKSISLNNLLKEKEKEINNAEKNASPKTTPEKNTRTRPERTPPEAKRRSSDIVKKDQPKIDRFMTAKTDQGSKVNDIRSVLLNINVKSLNLRLL